LGAERREEGAREGVERGGGDLGGFGRGFWGGVA